MSILPATRKENLTRAIAERNGRTKILINIEKELNCELPVSSATHTTVKCVCVCVCVFEELALPLE
jgi:hypothetical protein